MAAAYPEIFDSKPVEDEDESINSLSALAKATQRDAQINYMMVLYAEVINEPHNLEKARKMPIRDFFEFVIAKREVRRNRAEFEASLHGGELKNG